MIRLALLFALILTLSSTAFAAEDVITLDDATPSIDAVISLPAGATGGVSVELAGASVTLFDASGNIVLNVADERIHSLQFNLMPDTGDHTLRVERLDGVDQAAISIDSLAEFLPQPTAQKVNSNEIGVDQSADIVLNATTPNAIIDVNIPANTMGLFSASVPNTATMNQMVDNEGHVIATTMNGHVDSLSMLMDGGDYEYTMLGMNLTDEAIVDVRVTPYDFATNPILYVQQAEPVVVENSAQTVANTTSSAGCNASVFVSSVNLRSGPGTGYSVLDYGFQNETFPVGGTNAQNNWIVIGLEGNNSAWMTRSAANLSGDCNNLTVFDVPYREAQPAEVVIVTAEQPAPIIVAQPAPVTNQVNSNNNNNQSNNSNRRHDDDDHDDHDDDHDERDHDDDDD